MPLTLAVAGDRVLLRRGAQRRVSRSRHRQGTLDGYLCPARTLVVHDKTVFAANADPAKVTLTAFDLTSGVRWWSREAGSLPNFLFFSPLWTSSSPAT